MAYLHFYLFNPFEVEECFIFNLISYKPNNELLDKIQFPYKGICGQNSKDNTNYNYFIYFYRIIERISDKKFSGKYG